MARTRVAREGRQCWNGGGRVLWAGWVAATEQGGKIRMGGCGLQGGDECHEGDKTKQDYLN